MELAKKRRKTIVVVLSIVIGFIVPVFMIVGFIPIALGEIAILRALRNKGKRYVILNFIFGLHLIGFPIGIVVMIIYNIVVGIK